MGKKSLAEAVEEGTVQVSVTGDGPLADAIRDALEEPPADTLEAESLPKTPLQQTLPCRITPEEKAEAAQMMASAYNDLQDCLGRKKEMTAQYKAEEEQYNSAISRYARTVRSEFEHRPVACERVIDYAVCEARTYRKDTGEIVNIRELTPAEMQTKMELEEAAHDGTEPEAAEQNLPAREE